MRISSICSPPSGVDVINIITYTYPVGCVSSKPGDVRKWTKRIKISHTERGWKDHIDLIFANLEVLLFDIS